MRCLLPLLAIVSVFAADAPAPLRVFLRCGPKSHGPGDHDHPAFARDWQPLLTQAGMKVSVGDADAKGVQTFPSDEELARTDVLVIHRQGGGDFKPDERARVEKFAARGGSFVVIHAGAVAGNDASADFYKDLVGGSWRQKVTKWREGPMELKFVDKEHVITKGIADFGMKDEIYYDMDLRADIHALATAPTPKKKGDGFEAQTQLWKDVELVWSGELTTAEYLASHQALWEKARAEANFAHIRPSYEQIDAMRRQSSRVGQRLDTFFTATERSCSSSRLRRISAMPNRPIASATKLMPSDSSPMPKV